MIVWEKIYKRKQKQVYYDDEKWKEKEEESHNLKSFCIIVNACEHHSPLS